MGAGQQALWKEGGKEVGGKPTQTTEEGREAERLGGGRQANTDNEQKEGGRRKTNMDNKQKEGGKKRGRVGRVKLTRTMNRRKEGGRVGSGQHGQRTEG